MNKFTSSKLMEWPIDLVVELTRLENEAYYQTRGRILPEREHCLRAFKDTGPADVRVVIVGQDPYHSFDGKGNIKACGRAFAYHPNYSGQPNSSMRNIIEEIGQNVQTFDTSLQHWVNQGVLLLNTCLTVEAERPLSHANCGWEQAISDVLKFLKEYADYVFIAWGNKARDTLLEAGIPAERMVVTSHPSRYSAHAGANPFIGSKWHLQVNKKLRERNKGEVIW